MLKNTGVSVGASKREYEKIYQKDELLNYLFYALPEYVTARILTNQWRHEETHHNEKASDDLMQKQHDMIDKYHEVLEHFKTNI